MTSAGDDLTPLLVQEPAAGLGFRQGVVVFFDRATLENVIRVGGADLPNLPVLGVGESTMLAVGDVVGILTFGSTMAVLGQLVIPGSAGSAMSLTSSSTYSATTADVETSAVATWGDLATVGPVVPDVRIGPSGRCLVYITSSIRLVTSSGGGEMAYEISGATTVPIAGSPPALAYYGPAGSGPNGTFLVSQEGLNPGLHTFTAKYLAQPDSPGGAAQFGGRALTIMAL
jgi:hypothetical protein